MSEDKINEGVGGLDRRTMLKRSAVVGGALVWTTPVVQSLASPAFAATSPIVQGCIGQKMVAVKFDGQLEPLNSNENQCVPAGAEPGIVAGVIFFPAINNTSTADTLTFTLGAGDTFISICAKGGTTSLDLVEVSRTLNGDGTTTFVFRSTVNDPNISNFSVLFGDCP